MPGAPGLADNETSILGEGVIMVHRFTNNAWDRITLNLLRMVTGFLFIPHGAQKLFGVLGRDAVPLMSLPGVAGVLEFFGGIAILLGLFTRPVAFVLSGLMASAEAFSSTSAVSPARTAKGSDFICGRQACTTVSSVGGTCRISKKPKSSTAP